VKMMAPEKTGTSTTSPSSSPGDGPEKSEGTTPLSPSNLTEPTMRMLASYYNMTMFSSTSPERVEQRYLLDINPHYIIEDQSDTLNMIDGRWVDTWTGLFIDMTVTRSDGKGGLNCKDGHRYKVRIPSMVNWAPY
jgi:hypothetical protein